MPIVVFHNILINDLLDRLKFSEEKLNFFSVFSNNSYTDWTEIFKNSLFLGYVYSFLKFSIRSVPSFDSIVGEKQYSIT